MNVGLLGCGRIARFFHLDILAHRSPFRLVAVADADERAREAVAARVPGAELYADFRALIDEADVDSVVVCLPPALHAPAGIAAFEAGKHVYMEKPIAPTSAEAAPLVEAWKRSGRVGMMGFNYRFDPSVREAREAIRKGRLGEIVAVRSTFTSESRPLPNWKESRAEGGGVLLDLASHHVDLVRFLLDEEPTRGFATLRSDRVEDDHATVELVLTSGVTVQSFFSLGSVHDHRIDVHGRDALLRIDRFRRPSISIRSKPRTSRASRLRRSLAEMLPNRWARSFGEPTYAEALSAFAAAVSESTAGEGSGPTETPSPSDVPDLYDGMRTAVLIEQLERSARTGTPVSFDVPPDRLRPAE